MEIIDTPCEDCVYRAILAFMLDRCTGTGKLTITRDDVFPYEDDSVEVLIVRRAKKETHHVDAGTD